LAIVDVQLPGRSGISMLRELRDRKACIPVIMFSGNATSQVRRECMTAGAACFVSKPVAPDVLLEIVNQTLDGEQQTG
jgi:DNA-binding NarL/FixJ family response regulator